MILPDVNILVYGFRSDLPQHPSSRAWLESVRSGPEPLGLADAVLTSFLRLVTNRRVFADAVTISDALSFTSALRETPNCRNLVPSNATWEQFSAFASNDPYIVGNHVPDAWLAALAMSNGARLATADAGFARFKGLSWFNPLLA